MSLAYLQFGVLSHSMSPHHNRMWSLCNTTSFLQYHQGSHTPQVLHHPSKQRTFVPWWCYSLTHLTGHTMTTAEFVLLLKWSTSSLYCLWNFIFQELSNLSNWPISKLSEEYRRQGSCISPVFWVNQTLSAGISSTYQQILSSEIRNHKS